MFIARPLFAGMSSLLAALATLWLAAVAPTAAHAQAGYPERPVKLLVPYPPGGAMDLVGRILAKDFSERTGQPMVVENKPGAATIIAATALAGAAPDGYTLMLAPNSTLTIIPQLYAKLPFDVKRLEAVALVGTNQMVFSTSSGSGLNDLAALVGKARGTPKSVSYGSFGNGNITHLLGELLNQSAGIAMLHVPYQGAAPAMSSLLGGNITATFDTVTNVAPQVQAGKLRALAVTGRQRSPLLPDTPTFAESGYPALAAVDSWIGLLAPAGMDARTRTRLDAHLDHILRDPAFVRQLNERGFDVPVVDAAMLARRIEEERGLYRQVIDKANIRLD